MALNTNAYPKLKQYLEISSENDLHKLEMLTNEKDSAICSLIREKLLSGIGKEYVWDLEKKRYFPSDYIIIYRASVQAYIAFTGKYNIGYNDRGERPLILGGGHFFVFDENLNPIQNIEY